VIEYSSVLLLLVVGLLFGVFMEILASTRIAFPNAPKTSIGMWLFGRKLAVRLH
jgi:hypothetical protein